MTMTKKKKRILLIAVPAALLVAVAGVVLWLVLGRGEPEKPFLVLRDQQTNQIVGVTLQTGLETGEEIQRPLAFYGFNAPEGWTHPCNAEKTASRYSTGYIDDYSDENDCTVTLEQRVPYKMDMMESSDHLQEIQFGDTQVIYLQDLDEEGEVAQTMVYWVHENSLLSITYQADIPVNQMLELLGRMDYETIREPEYSTLTLQISGFLTEIERTTHYIDLGTYYYHSQGNPQVTAPAELPSLSQPPRGYTLTSERSDTESASGFFFRESRYENEEGEVIQFYCHGMAMAFFNRDDYPFSAMTYEELQDPASVKTVTMDDGRSAFVHINQDVAEIGWIDGYCTLEIRCTAPMTEEELIALARTVQRSGDQSN